MQTLIDQMALYISLQTTRLDKCRLDMFLKWLKSHSSAVRNTKQGPVGAELHSSLTNSLKTWFESLPVPGLLWEYQLILTEIRWWRTLDERSLARIMNEETKEG